MQFSVALGKQISHHERVEVVAAEKSILFRAVLGFCRTLQMNLSVFRIVAAGKLGFSAGGELQSGRRLQHGLLATAVPNMTKPVVSSLHPCSRVLKKKKKNGSF